jgi:hypothetical protein
MNGEYTRIQAELLAKVIQRAVWILQKKGLIPKFKLDGKEVTVKYVSPFATTQNADDLMAFEKTVQQILALGPQLGPTALSAGLKIKDVPAYIARKNGLPESLIMTDEDRQQQVQDTVQAQQAAQANQAQHAGNQAAQVAQGESAGQQPPDQQGGPPPTPAQQ